MHIGTVTVARSLRTLEWAEKVAAREATKAARAAKHASLQEELGVKYPQAALERAAKSKALLTALFGSGATCICPNCGVARDCNRRSWLIVPDAAWRMREPGTKARRGYIPGLGLYRAVCRGCLLHDPRIRPVLLVMRQERQGTKKVTKIRCFDCNLEYLSTQMACTGKVNGGPALCSRCYQRRRCISGKDVSLDS